MQTSYMGVYRALVTTNVDPAGLGRIRTQCPQVAGAAELRWAEPVNIEAPIPLNNTLVWIAFSGGDVTKPMYFTNTVADIPVVGASLPSAPYQGQLAYETTTNTLQMWTGSVWKILSGYTPATFNPGVGQTNYITLANDFTMTSTTTLTAVTGMSFPVLANARYLLDGYLSYAGSVGGGGLGDLKLDWTVPASTTFRWARNGYPVGNTNQIDTVETDEVTIRALGTFGPSTNITAYLRGSILIGANAGTIQLRAAQNTSNATPTIMKNTSWYSVTRLS